MNKQIVVQLDGHKIGEVTVPIEASTQEMVAIAQTIVTVPVERAIPVKDVLVNFISQRNG